MRKSLQAKREKLAKIQGPHSALAAHHVQSAEAMLELAQNELIAAEFYVERRIRLDKNLKSIAKPKGKK